MFARANQQEGLVKPSSNFFRANNIFPKLTIGQPNDKYEQEADAMANKVTAMPEPSVAQRKCAECEAEESMQTKPLLQKKEKEEDEPLQTMSIQRSEEEEEPLQTKVESSRSETEASSTLQDQLRASKGGGSLLPDATNQFMSNAFGSDFSNVRVHNGHSAQEMNQGIQAKAFTHGSDIYFNKGQYSPETSSGKNLLAHELTHVVQQGAASSGIHKKEVIQRTEDLAATRFSGNSILERVFDGQITISKNSRRSGTHVRLIQESLLALGYTLPIHGADGVFGSETEAAIRLFQIDMGATDLDGIIGARTMRFLDMQDSGNTGIPGPVAPPAPVGPFPPATSAIFSEAPNEAFSGYDNSVAPNWLVVPVNARRRANVAITPVGANPTYVSDNPAVATVNQVDEGVVVTGVSHGTTVIKVMEGVTELARLRISVKNKLERTVDFHFMRDNAVPPHQTARSAATADRLTATLNQLWHRQANIRFRKGVVDSPTVPSNLGGQVLWTATLPNEWNTVTAFATGANLNVFLVWEYEQDATPLVDNTNAGTLAGNTILEDNECGDVLTIAHEAGHFLGLGHTGNGIMTGCPGTNRRKVFKVDVDIVNP
ncbi:DUF4157 domain-containing protein [Flammeovirgaceae bacterium SG7u.111]|nr:DUF4157 domain-containing protein [Flammeovirgaceae bacterium SG7u.132]WPO36491.1 DUF4157 domain-containing protein [Flammeovirgaceae bacterium SG7u.111]